MVCSGVWVKAASVASRVWHASHGVIGVLFGTEFFAHGRASSGRIVWCWVDLGRLPF